MSLVLIIFILFQCFLCFLWGNPLHRGEQCFLPWLPGCCPLGVLMEADDLVISWLSWATCCSRCRWIFGWCFFIWFICAQANAHYHIFKCPFFHCILGWTGNGGWSVEWAVGRGSFLICKALCVAKGFVWKPLYELSLIDRIRTHTCLKYRKVL